MSTCPLDLKNTKEQLHKVQQELRSLKQTPKLIVIDTLARHFGEAEETNAEMNKFINAVDELRQEFKSAILIVHHLGKETKRGSRGGSSLPAAVDHILSLEKQRSGGTINLKCEKAKDSGPFLPLAFDLVPKDVVDENGLPQEEDDGTTIRSCVLESREYFRSSKTQRFTTYQQIFIEVYNEEAAKTEKPDQLATAILKKAFWKKLPESTDKYGKWRDLKESPTLKQFFEFNDFNVVKKPDPHL